MIATESVYKEGYLEKGNLHISIKGIYCQDL